MRVCASIRHCRHDNKWSPHCICLFSVTETVAQAASKGGADWGARFDAMLKQRKLEIGDMDVETLELKVYEKVLLRRAFTLEMHTVHALVPCFRCMQPRTVWPRAI
jgi:uncharacterized metal-binding protein YceD (DUF177 family)